MSHPVRAFRLISHVHKNIEAIKESTFPTARINGELLSLLTTCIINETQAQTSHALLLYLISFCKNLRHGNKTVLV